jgi:hypothetical protein
VREVSRLGAGVANHLFALRQQRVQVVHQRLDFARVGASELALARLADAREPGPQLVDRRPPEADLPQAGSQQRDADERHERRMAMHAAEERRRLRVAERDVPGDDGQPEQADRPQCRTDQQTRLERERPLHAPSSRTR